uniref:DNA-directed RNA polymerase n=2 Tax=Helianthus annuus TaxID=4232 RepID=A0A251T1V4_HELAN
MAKAIPKKGSRGRISSRKSIRKIPKGVIHIQASFNNTIVTVTDVRGRVVSWSSAGTCGFQGTRRGTPFAAQTAAANAIRAVVDQGMQRAEVMIKGPGLGRDAALRAIRRSGILLTFVRDVTLCHIMAVDPRKKDKITVSTRTLQWKCVESAADSKRLLYGRFILSPLMKGQADTIGIAMRRALLGEIEGTCITRAKSEKISHEYATIMGIQESVHEILMNLKEIVLRSNLYGTCEASICVRGPGYVTAQDIILPPYVEIVDNTQHIASLTEPIELVIGLQIEKNRGYLIKAPNTFQDGSYPIDPVFMPVRNANHSIHSYENGNKEILFLEIWTNGSLTPKEALHEASRNLIDLLIPFLHTKEENLSLEDNQHIVPLPPLPFMINWLN